MRGAQWGSWNGAQGRRWPWAVGMRDIQGCQSIFRPVQHSLGKVQVKNTSTWSVWWYNVTLQFSMRGSLDAAPVPLGLVLCPVCGEGPGPGILC